MAEVEAVLLRLLLPLPLVAQITAPRRTSHWLFAAAVRCPARTLCRTKPLCTARPNTGSISSSNSWSPDVGDEAKGLRAKLDMIDDEAQLSELVTLAAVCTDLTAFRDWFKA